MCNMAAGGVERDYKLGYRMVIHEEFVASCKHFHHTILIPFKVVGMLMYPVYLYIIWRCSHPEATLSYAGRLAQKLNHMAKIDWWTIHKISLVSLLTMMCMMINEVALLASIINIFFLWILTLGNTQITNQRIKFVMELLHLILFPFMVVFQIVFTFWIPIQIAPFKNYFVYIFYLGWYIMSGCQIEISIAMITYFPTYQPFKHIDFLLSSFTKSLKITWKQFEKLISFVWSGLKIIGTSLVTVLETLFTKLFKVMMVVLNVANRSAFSILGFFDKILANMTRACRDMGFLGEILLIPLVFGWILWPLLIPYFVHSYVLYIPAAGVTMFLLRRGYGIIKKTY